MSKKLAELIAEYRDLADKYRQQADAEKEDEAKKLLLVGASWGMAVAADLAGKRTRDDESHPGSIDIDVDKNIRDLVVAGRDIVQATLGELRDCKYCEGTGRVGIKCPNCFGQVLRGDAIETCKKCLGLGTVFEICSKCEGQGQVRI